ncbi:unnamed protein product [Rhizophagus irregularis]|nr:unnamed protein product [Rhizophagus irregularis]
MMVCSSGSDTLLEKDSQFFGVFGHIENSLRETGSKSNLTIISFLFSLAGLRHFDYVNGAFLGSFFGYVGVRHSKPGFFVEFSGVYSLATSFSDTRMRTIMEF